MRKMTMHGATISFNGVEMSGKHDVELLVDDTPKVWDIKPPLGWNWTEDDWRMYNFFRDLDSHGGVLSGGLVDRYVLLKYNRAHPAKSLVIFEDVTEFGILPKQKDVSATFNKDGSSSVNITLRRQS